MHNSVSTDSNRIEPEPVTTIKHILNTYPKNAISELHISVMIGQFSLGVWCTCSENHLQDNSS